MNMKLSYLTTSLVQNAANIDVTSPMYFTEKTTLDLKTHFILFYT